MNLPQLKWPYTPCLCLLVSATNTFHTNWHSWRELKAELKISGLYLWGIEGLIFNLDQYESYAKLPFLLLKVEKWEWRKVTLKHCYSKSFVTLEEGTGREKSVKTAYMKLVLSSALPDARRGKRRVSNHCCLTHPCFLSLSPNSQLTTEEKIQAPWNWSNPVRGAQDVQLHQDPVHKEEPGSREQDPESQAAAETIKDRQ